MIENPWLLIDIYTYEKHMSYKGVEQLQTLSSIMKEQFYCYPVKTICILGIAGGNGLEHITDLKFSKIYGIDINKNYLELCRKRYSHLTNHLELLQQDLIIEQQLPDAELYIANLFLEYIGIDIFTDIIKINKPNYVSCVGQMSKGNTFISSSPYEKNFEGLNTIVNSISPHKLITKMLNINYVIKKYYNYPLPNQKSFYRFDFKSET